MRKLLPPALLTLLMGLGCSAFSMDDRVPQAPPEWSLTSDGQYLYQRSTHLIWQRCLQGMRWTGKTCAGAAKPMGFHDAQALVNRRAQTDALPWRLPSVRELQQQAFLGKSTTLTSQILLPPAQRGWTWSSTAPLQLRRVNAYSYDNVMRSTQGQELTQLKFLHGWAVDTASGAARDDVVKRTPMFVRLVRPAD